MKKRMILFALLAIPALSLAQGSYVINGRIGSLDAPAKIFLMYESANQSVIDSAAVHNGSFRFTGKVIDITAAVLVIDHMGKGLAIVTGNNPDTKSVFLEQGVITVSGSDSLSKAVIGGTKSNDDYRRYLAAVKPVLDIRSALSKEYNAASDQKRKSREFNEYLQKKQSATHQQAAMINNHFIDTNPSSFVSLEILIDGANNESYPDVSDLQAKYAKLSPGLRKSKAGLGFKNKLDQMKIVAVGAVAPDFAQPDTKGKLIKLSSFRGKYVLIDFWASWCVPCRVQNPSLVKTFSAFKSKNFTILGISLDQPGKKSSWVHAIETDKLDWTQVSDLKGPENSAALLYQVKLIPYNLLLDPTGKIIAKNIPGDALEKKLTEILGGGSQSPGGYTVGGQY